LLRRVASGVDVLTYLGDYTKSRLIPAVGPHADKLQRLVPAVDAEQFRPNDGGATVRAELGWSDRPVIVCVSRLMPRKGQDVLVEALPEIRRRVPDAALLLVGGGPARSRIDELATRYGVTEHVHVTGSVPFDRLPAYYAAGDVFAMPCRDRLRGLDIEGLGMVFLEAAACGLPVVAGKSGGAPDAVRDADTGVLVDGREISQVADAVSGLLVDPDRARAMGARGQAWVRDQWTWERTVEDLQRMLQWTP
jgi:phosphatidylinositol alpha-1,6-mannosyltransferase